MRPRIMATCSSWCPRCCHLAEAAGRIALGVPRWNREVVCVNNVVQSIGANLPLGLECDMAAYSRNRNVLSAELQLVICIFVRRIDGKDRAASYYDTGQVEITIIQNEH